MENGTDKLGELNIDFSLRLALMDANEGRAIEALRRGADPNASLRGREMYEAHDYMPLLKAASAETRHQSAGLSIVAALLRAGADVHARSAGGQTALHRAATAAWPDAVEALLRAGADPRLADAEGQTPLHCASLDRPGWKISAKSIEILLAAGADPNAVNEFGLTPLHCVCANGHMDGMRALLKAGADPLAVCLEGRAAADFLAQANHANEAAKIKALSELKLAALERQSLNPSSPPSKPDDAEKKRRQQSARLINCFFQDKRASGNENARIIGDAVASPGGQAGLSIDALSISPLAANSALLGKITNAFNSKRLAGIIPSQHEHGVHKAGLDPYVEPWVFSWTTPCDSGDDWDEYHVRTKRFMFILPLQTVGGQGLPAPFLLMGETSYDYEIEGERDELKRSAALPDYSWLGQGHWSMALDAKAAKSFKGVPGGSYDIAQALMAEANRAWDFEWLLSPSRLEAKEISASTPSSASKPKPTL